MLRSPTINIFHPLLHPHIFSFTAKVLVFAHCLLFLRATHPPTHCSLVSASTVFLKLLLSKLLTFLFLVLVETFLFFCYFSRQEYLGWFSPWALEMPTLLYFLLPLHHCFSDLFANFLSSAYSWSCYSSVFDLVPSLLTLYTFSWTSLSFWDHQKRSPFAIPWYVIQK